MNRKLLKSMGVGMGRARDFRALHGDEVTWCEGEGYQIRGIDGVLRCDSGDYENDAKGALRCVHCRLRAA